jgi:hypothetical protein
MQLETGDMPGQCDLVNRPGDRPSTGSAFYWLRLTRYPEITEVAVPEALAAENTTR